MRQIRCFLAILCAAASVLAFAAILHAAETPETEVAAAFDKAVEEHGKTAETPAKLQDGPWEPKNIFTTWSLLEMTTAGGNATNRSDTLEQFVAQSLRGDEKSRIARRKIAAGYLDHARPQYRAVACEFLAHFPTETLDEGYLPALGRRLDDKAKAFDGVRVIPGQSFEFISRLPDGFRVADAADIAVSRIAGIYFPNAKVFDAWWRMNKDFRHCVWYWELRWSQVGVVRYDVPVTSVFGDDTTEHRLILISESEFPRLLREFSKDDALKTLLMAGETVTADDWKLLQPYRNPYSLLGERGLLCRRTAVSPETIARFVASQSLTPRLIELLRQDEPWPDVASESAKQKLLPNIIEVLKIAARPSDAAVLESALKNPSSTLKNDPVCQTTLTLLLAKLVPERLEEILLTQYRQHSSDSRLAAKLLCVTGLKHWVTIAPAAKDRNFRRAILATLGRLRSPETAKLLGELLTEDFASNRKQRNADDNFDLYLLLEEYVKATALYANRSVVADELVRQTYWNTGGKGDKDISQSERQHNLGVPAARDKAVKQLKQFFDAEANK